MFNFTTQSIYNEIKSTAPNQNMWVVANGVNKKPTLRIGNTRFDQANIESMFVKDPTPENLASVTFDMSEIIIGEGSDETQVIARIALYVGLSMNSQDALYANPFVYKGKPLFVEFPVNKGDTAAAVATRAKHIADKYLLFVMGEKIINVTVNGGNLTLTAVNGYQQFKKAVLQKFDPDAKKIDCCSNQGDFVDVITGVPVVYTAENGIVALTDPVKKLEEDGTKVELADNEVPIVPGLEAFGDYSWMIHNLRLPTAANTYFWSPTKQEMPVPGQVYTQFIIRIKAERDNIAGEVVGQRATSVTTHVLYVAGSKDVATSPAGKVYIELQKLGTVSTEADDKLEDPFNR